MTAWDRVRGCVEGGGAEQTAALVLTLTVQERREVAKELPGYLKRRLETAEWRMLDQQTVAPLLVAGLGCVGGAAGATSWLFRPPLRLWSSELGRSRAERPPAGAVIVGTRVIGTMFF